MSYQFTETEYASLGEYIRETRMKLGFDLMMVAEETKIPPKSLRAIEDNDFNALPAEAFTRGFYTLYAKMLSLDPEDVLQMYTQERPKQSKPGNISTLTASKMAQEVGSMAERPSFMPFSFLGLILLVSLLFGGFLCWLFSWNPAIFLSHKLRNLEQNTQQIEQILESRLDKTTPEPAVETTQLQTPQNTYQNLFDLPSPSNAAASVIKSDIADNFTTAPALSSKYLVNAKFTKRTELTLAIDELPNRVLIFNKGESVAWHANDKVVITLPARNGIMLSLNDIPLELPQQHKGSITISLPEYILQ